MNKQETASAILLFKRPFLSLYFRKNPLPEYADISSDKNLVESLLDFKPVWNEHTRLCLQFLQLTEHLSESVHVLKNYFPNYKLPPTSLKEVCENFLDFHFLLELESLKFDNGDKDFIKDWVLRVSKLKSEVSIYHILKLSYNLKEDQNDLISTEISNNPALLEVLEKINKLSN